jgi:HlyD family secretion protein
MTGVLSEIRFSDREVQRGPMTVTVEARGETRVLDRFVVSAPVAGNLERIPLRPGDSAG